LSYPDSRINKLNK